MIKSPSNHSWINSICRTSAIYEQRIQIFAVHSNMFLVSVLTLWVVPPKMFCNLYRIEWSRNQLWNWAHFWHLTDKQLGLTDISSNKNLRSAFFEGIQCLWSSHFDTFTTIATNSIEAFKYSSLTVYSKRRKMVH